MRHFFFAWMCSRSEMVVMTARMKKTTYMEANVITSEPMHMRSSPCVAMKPWERLPTMRYVALMKNESSVKIMPGAMVISMS